MTLPTKLSTIFRIKQKSYKMVLIISIIDEYKRLGNRQLPLDNLASRFCNITNKLLSREKQ